MTVSGLHLLLTFECNFECDHCFVWGGPRQRGTMTLDSIREILDQAEALSTVEWIYFEGGEPFLYYDILRSAVDLAAGRGFKVGIVSNGYWAVGPDEALSCLQPFVGLVQDLSISSDGYHWSGEFGERISNAVAAAKSLGIPTELISIAEPEQQDAAAAHGQIPTGQSAVVFRGRAAEKLAARAVQRDWTQFKECPFEDLRAPERVHLDPLGNVHICQGILLGNVFEKPLTRIFDDYDPDSHPVTGPLLKGGPAELSRSHGLSTEPGYADACQLCYRSRVQLRHKYPQVLAPDQMYGDLDPSATDASLLASDT